MVFSKFEQPIFLKANNSSQEQLSALKSYLLTADVSIRERIQNDIKMIEYGQAGERNIQYELQNSHIPMYVIHDLYLAHEGNTAQIDYLIITKAGVYCIECKNLVGDIEVNARGEFIRTNYINGYKKKEGIYSPITQNERHYQLIKAMRVSEQNSIITKFLMNKIYDDINHLLVVIANPKSVLNVKYAPKIVKDKIVRADQLVQRLKDDIQNCRFDKALSNNFMEQYADYFIRKNKKKVIDYLDKYKKVESTSFIESDSSSIETSPIYNELRSYRLKKAKEEQIKPYYIYNDMQMKEIIKKKPIDKKSLTAISGFAEVKWIKYGTDICNICKKYL
ncbi:MAG: NERD domain-containing protein [Erysipelotrichaceae bacterium]|nr:NERD domain-containing protein [Erysipelotrichaceae bacterium]